MIARLFSDGLKRCFQGILQMVVQHQDKPKIIRLRNKFVPIDPRGWDAKMDMVVNIALGRGSDEQRMAFLMTILQQQKEIIAQYGPSNPIVSVEKFRDTLAEITKLSGFQDPDKFWNQVTPESLAQYQQMMAQNQRPDPAQMLAQVEAEKIKADILINAAKQELEKQKAIAQADLERDKLYIDAVMKAAEINAKYNAQIDMAVIKGEVDKQRAEINGMFNTVATVAPAVDQNLPPMGMQ